MRSKLDVLEQNMTNSYKSTTIKHNNFKYSKLPGSGHDFDSKFWTIPGHQRGTLSSNRIAHCMTIISRLSLNLKIAEISFCFSNGFLGKSGDENKIPKISETNTHQANWEKPGNQFTNESKVTKRNMFCPNLAAHVVRVFWGYKPSNGKWWRVTPKHYVQLRRMIGFFPNLKISSLDISNGLVP